MNDEKVIEAMDLYGGGFIQQLARLWRHADSNNQERIKGAWPEYWKQYTIMAVKINEKPV